jgi:hypothetical protein
MVGSGAAAVPDVRSRPPVTVGPSGGIPDLGSVVRRLAAHRRSWAPLVRFDARLRWHTPLPGAAGHEAWLLTWLPGQRTGLHDHGDSSGAFAVVAGVLVETTVRVTGRRPVADVIEPAGSSGDAPALAPPAACRTVSRTEAVGSVRTFGPAHVHEIANLGDAPAVSIHAYAPKLVSMRRYDLDPRMGLVEVGRDWAGLDW